MSDANKKPIKITMDYGQKIPFIPLEDSLGNHGEVPNYFSELLSNTRGHVVVITLRDAQRVKLCDIDLKEFMRTKAAAKRLSESNATKDVFQLNDNAGLPSLCKNSITPAK